jgi:hypothetical protein
MYGYASTTSYHLRLNKCSYKWRWRGEEKSAIASIKPCKEDSYNSFDIWTFGSEKYIYSYRTNLL